jgi:hypothetical protein
MLFLSLLFLSIVDFHFVFYVSEVVHLSHLMYYKPHFELVIVLSSYDFLDEPPQQMNDVVSSLPPTPHTHFPSNHTLHLQNVILFSSFFFLLQNGMNICILIIYGSMVYNTKPPKKINRVAKLSCFTKISLLWLFSSLLFFYFSCVF